MKFTKIQTVQTVRAVTCPPTLPKSEKKRETAHSLAVSVSVFLFLTTNSL